MIVDRLENWKTYPYGAAWKSAFIIFFPHDAHMPYLMIGNKSEQVKKVVVKIKVKLLLL